MYKKGIVMNYNSNVNKYAMLAIVYYDMEPRTETENAIQIMK
jgi:hypothetical protein